MKTPINIIVTGSNRGIGKAICELIIARQAQHKDQPLKLFAASRKGEDIGLKSDNIAFPKLDISSHDSIQSFSKQFRQGEVNVLINNAGVNLDAEYGPENVKRTLDVNYRGTLEMCQTFIPLLAPNGRIVNISSVGSSLRPYQEHIQHRFRNSSMTLADLEDLAEEFEQSVQNGTENKSGFGEPRRSYSVSKACINAFTRILAEENPGLTFNACCPGWVNTDMGHLVGNRTPPKEPIDGAAIPYKLAFEDIDGVTGAYWANSNVRSKETGQVQEW